MAKKVQGLILETKETDYCAIAIANMFKDYDQFLTEIFTNVQDEYKNHFKQNLYHK